MKWKCIAPLPLDLDQVKAVMRWSKLCLQPEAKQPGSPAWFWPGPPGGANVFVRAALGLQFSFGPELSVWWHGKRPRLMSAALGFDHTLMGGPLLLTSGSQSNSERSGLGFHAQRSTGSFHHFNISAHLKAAGRSEEAEHVFAFIIYSNMLCVRNIYTAIPPFTWTVLVRVTEAHPQIAWLHRTESELRVTVHGWS